MPRQGPVWWIRIRGGEIVIERGDDIRQECFDNDEVTERESSE